MIKRQRGVALIVALMVFAIVSGVAVSVLSSVNQTLTIAQFSQRDVQQKETLLGGEAWAMAWLASQGNEQEASLVIDWQAPWQLHQQNFPLDEEGQSLEIEIVDRQTCINVNGLVQESSREVTRQRLMRLSSALGVESLWIDHLSDWVDEDQSLGSPNSREDEYYLGKERPYRTGDTSLSSLSELTLLGLDDALQTALAPYICALPVELGMNINRMSDVMLKALLPDISADQRASITAQVQTTGYPSVDDFVALEMFEGKDMQSSDWRIDSRFVEVFVTFKEADFERVLHSQLVKTNTGTVVPVTRSFGAFDVLSNALLTKREQE
ncbi:hypothetical protein DN730_09490 [Marinomonas piezotolerans]|uniref:Type II secretion system protein K n=1 Tax=Marinomonas piezotolerans TaxID=2213058 RepID=A0A370UA27_9GAMM|nr:type II secretion system minor pseudopilin GspK [Marinomonas piezotolerans]RDL44611.1 hypothetical protein DN730_09490 [Marinomonas piezotolerans]